MCRTNISIEQEIAGKRCVLGRTRQEYTPLQRYVHSVHSATPVHIISRCRTDPKGELLVSLEHMYWLHFLTCFYMLPPVFVILLTSYRQFQDECDTYLAYAPSIASIRIFVLVSCLAVVSLHNVCLAGW